MSGTVGLIGPSRIAQEIQLRHREQLQLQAVEGSSGPDMALMQPNTPEGIAAALAQHGVAQGPKKLLLKEKEAAEAAVRMRILLPQASKRK